jgi:phosphoribosylformylglycinamidine synthase
MARGRPQTPGCARQPDCAQEEFDRIADPGDWGLSADLGFDPQEDIAAPSIATGARQRIAILRE